MKVGDVVKLNSGSPLLTVIGTAKNYITVTWFDDNGGGGWHVDRFPEPALTSQNPPSPVKAVA